MASERDDCIDKIVKAAGGKISRAEAMDALDEILARAERKGQSWKAMDEKLAEAAKEMSDALLERATIAARAERMEALKAIARHKFYDRAPNLTMGLEAKLGGVNVPFEGNRMSVDAAYKGLRRQIIGGFWSDLEREGLDRLWSSRALEREWATELYELNKAKGGRPGITGSAEALKIAETVRKWQIVSITAINKEGGWIKSYSGYITRTSHDSDKIRRAGRDAWVDATLARIDVERTFHDGDPNQARKLLADMWPQFVTGDHFDYSRPLDDLHSVLDIDFAKKASARRELHFKSADDWLAYNKEFGRMRPTAQVTRAFDDGAKLTALIRDFGPRPLKAFEEDIHYLKAKLQDKPDEFAQLTKREPYLRSIFAQLDGTANRPVGRLWATIGANVRSVMRMSKLGLTPYAMLSDLATKASELRYQGMTVPERFGSTVADYFRGAVGSEKRQVAELMGQAIDSEIASMVQRLDTGDMVSDGLARAEQRFFRITGMNAMTYNQQHAAERIMARHMGAQRGKAFAELGEGEARILKQFEIGKAEWDLLHKVDWNEIEGTTYLTAEVPTRLSDADIRAYLVGQGRVHKDAPEGAGVTASIGKARDDLALKLASYFTDRGEYAVLQPGARERAMLYGGHGRDWAPGTAKGEAWRLFMQFKQFPATMMTKTWSREIYGGQGRMGAIAGLTEFIVYGTALGIVANALNDVTKGQDPFSRWRIAPTGAVLAGFLRGGVASIYGDFLLGEWSRHGLGPSANVLGPSLGQIDRVFEIWSNLTHMKAGRATASASAGFVRQNLPYMNMIYTKMLFDYLVYYRIQEAINPGFLERYERMMKDRSGIEFWLRPTQVSR